MKIIEPSFEILQCPDGEECLAFLERCARTCYKSEDKIDPGREQCVRCKGQKYSREDNKTEIINQEWPIKITMVCPSCDGTGLGPLVSVPSSHKLIRHVLDRGHESVIEHMVVTVKFIVDRGFLAEITRHRIASFSVESTRFCNYANDKFGGEVTFIRPCFWPIGSGLMNEWEEDMAYAERRYLSKIAKGAKPEEARSVLPLSLKTEIVMTTNLRELRSVVFEQRAVNPYAHPQMRQVMKPFLEELRTRIPVIFEDVGA